MRWPTNSPAGIAGESSGSRARVAVSPSRTGSGDRCPRGGWTNLSFMDFDALLNQAIAFSSEGIGAFFLNIAENLYALLYPANSDPAVPVEIPA